MESSLILIWLPHFDMNLKTIERFCKDAPRILFNEFDFISLQINSFDPPSNYSDPLSSSFDRSNRSREKS